MNHPSPVLWIILALLGVPSSVVLRQLLGLDNPLWILPLFIGYEAILFMLRIWTKAMSKVEDSLAAALAVWLETRFKLFVDPYKPRYLAFLKKQHSTVSLLERSVNLADVFVDLRVIQRRKASEAKSPMVVNKASEVKSRMVGNKVPEGTHDVNVFLKTGQNLTITGAPGSGKTTLLRHLARTRLTRRGGKIPVYLKLSKHALQIASDAPYDLAAAIRASLQEKGLPPYLNPPTGKFERYLERGNCLILLDALDEVAEQDRDRVVHWIDQQIVAHAKNQFLITSRKYGLEGYVIEQAPTLVEIVPLTNAQIHELSTRLFVQDHPTKSELPGHAPKRRIRQWAEARAKGLLAQMDNMTDLRDLAVNPLLLTMITLLYDPAVRLPETRAELYQEIMDHFCGERRRQADAQTKLPRDKKQVQEILQPLAWAMLQAEKPELPLEDAGKVIHPILTATDREREPSDFLRDAANETGLIGLDIIAGREVVYFAHKTFYEFLAAVHAAPRHLSGGGIRSEVAALQAVVAEGKWREVLRFYCARAGNDASPLLKACLDHQPMTAPVLALAFDCFEEAKLIYDETIARQKKTIVETWITHSDPAVRKIAVLARLMRRLRDIPLLDQDHGLDPSLITNAEYQLFLDESYDTGKGHQPDHWLGRDYPAGQGNAPILGLRGESATAFCTWLNDHDQLSNSQWQYRLPTTESAETPPISDGRLIGYWLGSGTFSGGLPRFSRSSLETLLSQDIKRTETASHWPSTANAKLFPDEVEARFARDLARALALALALARALARALALQKNLEQVISQAQESPALPFIVQAWLKVRIINSLLSDANHTLDFKLKRLAYGRLLLLVNVWILQTDRPTYGWGPRAWLRRWQNRSEPAKRQKAIAVILSNYAYLAEVSERLEGRRQPIEGLRIARVRKPNA